MPRAAGSRLPGCAVRGPGVRLPDMANVMIRCPNTGQAVPTGIGMDFETFRQVTMRDNSVRCRACGEIHVWQQEDAFPDS
jgi:hypothetical protein